MGDEWVEIRSTAAGSLDSAPLELRAPGRKATKHEGVLSLVVPESGTSRPAKGRRLPTLYLGRAPIFAQRELSALERDLELTLQAILESRTQPIYWLQACRIDGHTCLYGGDAFNRSAYRRKLARLGMEFAEEPYVRLTERGTFSCSDWGELTPGIVITKASGGEPEEIMETSGAILLGLLSLARLGALGTAELSHLVRACAGVTGTAAGDAGALLEHIKSSAR
ncbi:MAG TPA: hypothetical protein VFE20_08035 [Thermoleophilia bacterium]|nr:hypothetical protein [Thermoleophilia bacterium]